MINMIVYSTLTGSHLYGTNTPTSDLDRKHIILPDINDLLNLRNVGIVSNNTNKQKNVKNDKDDIDEEYIPLQIFASDFLKGQTYALELAFSLKDNSVCSDMFRDFVRQLKQHFLTSDAKAMMGYVYNQANIYSFKGERLNIIKEFLMILKENSSFEKISTIESKFKELLTKYPKYFKVGEYLINQTQMRPCFFILEKVIPFSNTIDGTIDIVEKIEKSYGDRAKEATINNVDWKAMMHALRIIDQAIELYTFKTITLPRPVGDVSRLLSVRRGEENLEDLKKELVEKINLITELIKKSGLKTSTELREEFNTFMNFYMRKFYEL